MYALRAGVALVVVSLGSIAYAQLAERDKGTREAGPRARWCMNECIDPNVPDCTGHGFDAVFYEDPDYQPGWVPGVSGCALEFIGHAMAWNIPPSWDDTVSGGLSIAAWVCWYGASGNCQIFDGRDGNNGLSFLVQADGTVEIALVRPGSDQVLISPLSLALCEHRWAHVAAVFDNTSHTLSLFIDGVLVATGSAPYPYAQSSQPAAIGNNHWAPGDGQWVPFHGVIDELCFYDRALTAQEVVQLYSADAPYGDMNCDGMVDFGDINPFVLALTCPPCYEIAFPDCYIMNGDINDNCYVDFQDINPFIALLTGGG